MTAKILYLATAAMLAGCASQPLLTTPTGKPEVFVRGHTREQIIDALVERCVSNGGTPEQALSTVTCRSEATPGERFWYATIDGTVVRKATVAVITASGGYRLVATRAWVESTNGYGGVVPHDLPLTTDQAGQASLASLAEQLNATAK